MAPLDEDTSFRLMGGPEVEGATLVDGLPGYGMVACIAVRQLVDQLDLDHYGSVVSAEHFSVLSHEAGRLRDPVRVYARREPPVVALQSDVAISPQASAPLSRTLVEALESSVERAIFLVEIPATSPEAVGNVSGFASSDEMGRSLREAGVSLGDEKGTIVGPTGAVASQFFRADIPTAVLLVETATDVFTPDPEAARILIDDALDPLLGFDVDTTELEEQEGQIRREMRGMAAQVERMMESDPSYLRMYY